MSISDAAIGRGDLIVSTEGNTFPFRFDIRQSGIRCYSKPNGADFTSLFDVLKRSTVTAIRPGSHLVLTGLPASPADAFRGLSLSYTPDAFTLTVVNADAFSPRLNCSLKDLHLDFRFRLGARRLQVVGGVTLVLFNREIRLTAQLTDSSGLVFRPDPATAPLPIATIWQHAAGRSRTRSAVRPVGRAAGALRIWRSQRQPQQRHLWRISCGRPRSAGPEIGPSGRRNRFPAGHFLWEDGLSGIPDSAPDPSPAKRSKDISSKPATKITHACRETNEITLAAWLKPTATVQGGRR